MVKSCKNQSRNQRNLNKENNIKLSKNLRAGFLWEAKLQTLHPTHPKKVKSGPKSMEPVTRRETWQRTSKKIRSLWGITLKASAPHGSCSDTMSHTVNLFIHISSLVSIHCKKSLIWFKASAFCYTINVGLSLELLLITDFSFFFSLFFTFIFYFILGILCKGGREVNGLRMHDVKGTKK